MRLGRIIAAFFIRACNCRSPSDGRYSSGDRQPVSADPVTAKPDELSTSGTLHAIAPMIGIPGIPVAAMLISSTLWKTNPAWAPHRSAIMWSAHATWISLMLLATYPMWGVPRAGGFNIDVWAGWMNRLVVATYLT